MTENHLSAIGQRSSDIHSPFLREKQDRMSAARWMMGCCEGDTGFPGGDTLEVLLQGQWSLKLQLPQERKINLFAAELLCCTGLALLPWKYFDFIDSTVRPGIRNTQPTSQPAFSL